MAEPTRWTMRARTFILAFAMAAVVECAKPTKEMLKLQRSGPGNNTGDLKPQRLREPYLCEGCRLVLEEVDQQIQTEICHFSFPSQVAWRGSCE